MEEKSISVLQQIFLPRGRWVESRRALVFTSIFNTACSCKHLCLLLSRSTSSYATFSHASKIFVSPSVSHSFNPHRVANKHSLSDISGDQATKHNRKSQFTSVSPFKCNVNEKIGHLISQAPRTCATARFFVLASALKLLSWETFQCLNRFC